MPVRLIKPNQNLRVRINAPRRVDLRFTVEADRPVRTLVFDEAGLKSFDQGEDGRVAEYHSEARRLLEDRVTLPAGTSYLVIMNTDKQDPVAVRYEVSLGAVAYVT